MRSAIMRWSTSILVSIHCFGYSRGSSSRCGCLVIVAGQLSGTVVAVTLEQHEGDHAKQYEDKIGDGQGGLGLYSQGIDAAIAEQRGEDEADPPGESADDTAMTLEAAEGIGEQVIEDKARAYVEHHHENKQRIQI